MNFRKITLPVVRTTCPIFLFMLAQTFVSAQRTVFAENFERKELASAWQLVSGDWHIEDVQELRIAPAENGYRYVLCSRAPGIIQVLIDIPDSLKASQIIFKLAYYTYANGPGATIQIEFHRKGWKDGMKGKIFKTYLPVRGRWIEFRKTLPIPKEANQLHVIIETGVPVKIYKAICFDSILLSVI